MHLFLNCLAASAGGGVTYLRNVVPHLAQRSGLKVTLAAQEDLDVHIEPASNISIKKIKTPGHAAGRFFFEQAQLPSLLRESRADLLISTGNFALRHSPIPQILLSGNSLYVSGDFYRDLRKRRAYSMWLSTLLRGYYARRSIHWADRTVAPSEAFAEQLRMWTGRQVLCIHHGFDPDIFSADAMPLPADIQNELDTSTDTLRLLFVSHYNYYRNFETLLRAVPLLVQRLTPRKLRLYLTCKLRSQDNPGSFDASSAQALVRQLNISEQVVELGAVQYWHLHKLHRACDIYVTAAYAETFAHPLVEAMASGLPIVASDLPVHREITAGAARFFNPFSAEELANRVLELAESAPLRAGQTQAGLKRAQDFSWAKHVDELVGLSAALLQNHRG
jgi:glycosyltransferase involved in cell wall biosynthesis